MRIYRPIGQWIVLKNAYNHDCFSDVLYNYIKKRNK